MIPLLRLLRPGILAAVLLAMAVAACAAGPAAPHGARLGHALLGTGLLVAGALALNQRLEQRPDALMARTAARPLPAGDLAPRAVAAAALASSAAGAGYLVFFTSATLAALAVLSWALYTLVYTPLKRRSPWQTPVGAVAGAMPMLLGAAACRGRRSQTAGSRSS